MYIKSFLKIFSQVGIQSILSTCKGCKVILETIRLVLYPYYPLKIIFKMFENYAYV